MKTEPNDFWNTPHEVFRAIDHFFSGGHFDPCPPNPKFDGLSVDWGTDCYINPPYSKALKRAFINKAHKEYQGGRYLWMFNYANSEDLWRVHEKASAVLIPKKRFRFIPNHPDLKESSPRYDNIMILWGDPSGFQNSFEHLGKVYVYEEGF